MTDSAPVDAFGRQRVGNPLTLFSNTLIHDSQPLVWDDAEVSGSGTSSTHDPDGACQELTVAAASAGHRARQTFRRFVYQPGKSQAIAMTGVLGAPTPGVITRLGQFDDENGLFFQVSEDGIAVGRRSSVTGTPVDTIIPQEDWNIQKLDGTNGPNAISERLRSDMAQVFLIDYQWLGVGRVRFGVDIDGVAIYVHEIRHANNIDGVYMSTANNPLRYEIISDGSNVAEASIKQICSTVIAEGGQEKRGQLLTAHTGPNVINANTQGVRFAMLGIRQKADQLDSAFDVEKITILVSTNNDPFYWELIRNPSVTGTFTYTDIADSSAQVALGSTANPSTNTVTGGQVLTAGYAWSRDAVNVTDFELPLGAAIDGTRDTVVLVVTPLSANPDLWASMTWRELA